MAHRKLGWEGDKQHSVATTTHISGDNTSRGFTTARDTRKRCLWLAQIILPFALLGATATAAPRFVPDRILVKPKASLSETNFTNKLSRHGAGHHRTLRHLNVRIVAVAEDKAEAALASLRSDPDIEFAERDYIAEAAVTPNDPYAASGDEWHLSQIQAEPAWDFTTGTDDAVVAVLDSGVNTAHPDLAGQILSGYDFVGNTNYMADDFGHGTAVSGTIVAAGNNGIGVAGVAYGCRVLPVKVLDSSGFATYSCLAQGIKYAVEQGARVINISIAGSAASATLQDAVNYAWSSNVVIVAAAGNNANDVPQYPAACSNVVAVSATAPGDALASFSSYGSYVTLSAPGEGIWTTQRDPANPYGAWRGTSFASPIVAGVAALIASANPSLSNTQIVSLLEQTADDLGIAGFDVSFGYGRVNAFSAVAAATLLPGSMKTTLPPAVKLTSPPDSAVYSPGASVPLAASATARAASGAVTSVVFFANDNQLAARAVSPFTFNWTPPQPGSYSLTAVATDDRGLGATSAPVVIQVLSPDANAPFVTITAAPSDKAQLTSPQVLLAGTAGDDGRLDRVEVQVNDGPCKNATGSANWSAQIVLAPGNNVIRVRSVDAAGNKSPEVTLAFTFTYVGTAQLVVRTSGIGRVTPDLNGKLLEAGKVYRVKAVPGPGQAFAGWSGVESQSQVLSFTMQNNLTLVANFVPSPFPPVKGAYMGLMAGVNGVTPDSSGCFTLNVTASGAFTGRLSLAGSRRGFRGQFNLAGDSIVTVNRGEFSPLTLTLHIDLMNGTDRVAGSVTDGDWVSGLAGDRNVFNVRLNPALQAGSRAFTFERANDVAGPAATNSGAISASGTTRIRGRLADGRAFSVGSTLARNGDYPFCLTFKRGGEVIIGWLNFPASAPDASGTVFWVRTGTNAYAATLQAASVP